MRNAFLGRPWRDSMQYIKRLAAHAHLSGGSTPPTVIVCHLHVKGSTNVLRASKECGRTDDKSVRRGQ